MKTTRLSGYYRLSPEELPARKLAILAGASEERMEQVARMAVAAGDDPGIAGGEETGVIAIYTFSRFEEGQNR